LTVVLPTSMPMASRCLFSFGIRSSFDAAGDDYYELPGLD